MTTLVISRVANSVGSRESTFTVFTLSQTVYLLPYAILVVPLVTSTFPRLADRLVRGESDGYSRMVAVITRGVLAVGALGTAVLLACAVPIETVFSAVASANGGVPGMALALTSMATALIGYGLVFHLSRSLYALERGRAAVVGTSIGWLTAIAVMVAVAAATYDGTPDPSRALVAIGVGLSIGMTVAAIVLLVALRRIAGPHTLSGLTRTTVVVVVGALAGAGLGRLLAYLIAGDGHALSSAVVAAIAGAVVAALCVGACVYIGDRALLSEIRHLERHGSDVPEFALDDPASSIPEDEQ